MTYKPGKHIYFAAGFFNDKQRELCDYVEGLEIDPYLPIYSPRRDGFVLKPDATVGNRDQVFQSNLAAIETCAMVLAVIDDFDAGVIWEMGYAYGVGRPILAYSDVPGRGLNVMLAGASRLGFMNGRTDLAYLLGSMSGWARKGHDPMEFAEFPRNTWPGEIQ